MTVLYEQDYGLWAEQMADLLSEGRFAELDIDNLVDEVRDLSKRDRDRHSISDVLERPVILAP